MKWTPQEGDRVEFNSKRGTIIAMQGQAILQWDNGRYGVVTDVDALTWVNDTAELALVVLGIGQA